MCTARSRSTSTVESSRLHGFRRTARQLSSKCTTVGFIKVRPQQWGTESVGSVIRRIGCENRHPCETEQTLRGYEILWGSEYYLPLDFGDIKLGRIPRRSGWGRAESPLALDDRGSAGTGARSPLGREDPKSAP